jgi:hypothetical protein
MLHLTVKSITHAAAECQKNFPKSFFLTSGGRVFKKPVLAFWRFFAHLVFKLTVALMVELADTLL